MAEQQRKIKHLGSKLTNVEYILNQSDGRVGNLEEVVMK
jgi:hypothetical protein